MSKLNILQYFRQRIFSKLSISLMLVLIGSVGLDQTSKFQAQKDLVAFDRKDSNDTDRVIGKSIPIGRLGKRSDQFFLGLKLTYARNKGAAFSMLSNLDDNIRIPFFYIVYFIATIMILHFLTVTPKSHIFFRFGLTMILSGAIGNFLDRYQYGYVVDFIDFNWKFFGWYHDFAIFNIADIAVNVGAISIVIDLIKNRNNEMETTSTPKAVTSK